MNFKKFKKYIVVNEENRPMSFKGNQFVYCQTHHNRSPFPLKLYSKEQAEYLIKKTVEYRIRRGFNVTDYNLIPVAPKIKSPAK